MLVRLAAEVGVKAVCGGALVVLFALVAQMPSPKRFAGVFAAAPSVALSSLIVTLVAKGDMGAQVSSEGMIAGAFGFIFYALLAPGLMRRWGTMRGCLLALGGWFGVAALGLVGSGAAAAGAASAATVPGPGREGKRPRIEWHPSRIRDGRPKDWWIRFGFGAATSAVAAVVSELAGSLVGGAFLAFPAILLASLTLVREQEGRAPSRDDARGAAAGGVGLVMFAGVCAGWLTAAPDWVVLVCALLGWSVGALGTYGVVWLAGRGGDEPSPGR